MCSAYATFKYQKDKLVIELPDHYEVAGFFPDTPGTGDNVAIILRRKSKEEKESKQEG